MEDDLTFSGDGRRPHYFWKWKTTSIFQEMEDDLNFSWNKRHINSSGNWRQPLIFWKWKTTRVFRIWKTTKVFRKLKTTSLSANVKYFHWPMLILNSQSKTICNSINLKLAWPKLSRAQPQLVLLLSPITHTGWLASTALPELGTALPQLVFWFNWFRLWEDQVC